MELISRKAKEKLLKAGYRIIGSHSAVKVCHWTKEALNRRRFCYKKWYGIESHRCVQMTPALQCNFNCLHCWRFHGIIPFRKLRKWDEPDEIIEGCLKAQRKLLSGFGGNPNVTREMFNKAMNPRHFAISLDGEPTLYPFLSELIAELKRRNITAFLVTNGSMSERLEKLEEEPTNLYISVYGHSKEVFERVAVPLIPNAWERFNESLELVKSFSCSTVLRLTLIKELNSFNPEGYAKLILRAEPKFVEVKSFFHVGEAQKRLPRTAMMRMEEIRDFASKLSECTGYGIKAEEEASRVVLLSRA